MQYDNYENQNEKNVKNDDLHVVCTLTHPNIFFSFFALTHPNIHLPLHTSQYLF